MSIASLAATWSLSLTRLMAGLQFMQHGTQKLLGPLIVIGFLTRPAAFLASGMCAAAYFLFHAQRSFFPIVNAGELAALYCFVFLYLAAAGAGPWIVDAKLGRGGLLSA